MTHLALISGGDDPQSEHITRQHLHDNQMRPSLFLRGCVVKPKRTGLSPFFPEHQES